MKPLITPKGMRELEQRAFERGVPSLLLMEQAARGAFLVLRGMLNGEIRGKRVLFVCGAGNNGGDGLAMARLFHLAGGEARVLLPAAPQTPDAQANLAYLRALGVACVDAPCESDVVVDALFGTGFHGEIAPDTPIGQVIAWINAQGAPVLALDVPSGMDAGSGAVLGACVRAAKTAVFHQIKQGLLLTPRRELVGEIIVVELGLTETQGELSLLESSDLRLPERAINAHKGDCGRVMLYAGSLGMAGAAIMAARAALRAGAGLCTVFCPREVVPIIQGAVPNAMCVWEGEPWRDAQLLGCGIAETQAAWEEILRLIEADIPTVWDAGALNLLSKHPLKLGARAVITPHTGEAARLLCWDREAVASDLVGAARALREKYACNVLLKSSVSVILPYAGQAQLSAAGTPALAKGGSGDALAGILVALLGQGIGADLAMGYASLWLGVAGRAAAARFGVRGVLTGDVIECMGEGVTRVTLLSSEKKVTKKQP